jgi:hypothetical protein
MILTRLYAAVCFGRVASISDCTTRFWLVARKSFRAAGQSVGIPIARVTVNVRLPHLACLDPIDVGCCKDLGGTFLATMIKITI